MGYAAKLVGALLLVIIAGGLAILLFEEIWIGIGLGAAIAIVVGGLLLLAWSVDRKAKAKRGDLPRV